MGVVKRWFKSYLDTRQQTVMIKQHMSECFQLNSGVPQAVASLTSTIDNAYASSLRPVLFLMYASGLFEVVVKHLTNIHTHANDTQLYVSFRPTSQANADNTIEKCIANVHNQMVSS